jgi:hypothetical protein
LDNFRGHVNKWLIKHGTPCIRLVNLKNHQG